jgi:exosortase B
MTGPTAFERTRDGGDWIPPVMVAAGLGVMFAPVFHKLAQTVWITDEQGHGPIILGVVAWLLWRRKDELKVAALAGQPGGAGGWFVLALGLLIYLVGRVQSIVTFEMGAVIPILVGTLAVVFGWRVVRVSAFPIFFLVFAVPLPAAVVDTLTQPLKQAVSWVADDILYSLGYPISRTGVILRAGQYELLIADACAGLNSMFTLEALGLLYMNVVGHASRLRNVLLAVLIVPMSFTANAIRVMVLVLVTYHFGDEAGQGVAHGAAGMILFGVALVLMFIIDSALGIFFRRKVRAA